MTETDLMRPVVEFFESSGHTCYQEPAVVLNGQTVYPDLVVIQRGLIRVIEGKQSLTDAVLEQIMRWEGYAHYRTVAVMEPQQRSQQHIRRRGVLARAGIGLLYVTSRGELSAQMRPACEMGTNPMILQYLDREHQPGGSGPASGVSSGSRIRRDDWDRVRDYIEDNPGATAVEIARAVHLNRKQRTDLLRLATRGELRGIRVEEGAGRLAFHPA